MLLGVVKVGQRRCKVAHFKPPNGMEYKYANNALMFLVKTWGLSSKMDELFRRTVGLKLVTYPQKVSMCDGIEKWLCLRLHLRGEG